MKKTILATLALPVILSLGACSKNDASPGQQNSTGTGGSLARFAITNDHLFTVSDQSVSAYDLSNSNAPAKVAAKSLGFGVETIFPQGNSLFIGTQTGMKILDVTKPDAPVVLSDYTHVRSCDPVIANDTYAFVTLRTGNTCTRGLNELQVLDITDLRNPKMVKTYPMKNPKGLALAGNNLFVCDEGIKHYDATDPANLVLKSTMDVQAEDLITHDGILMAIGPDGLTQYSYQTGNLVFLSRIPTL